MVNLNKILLPVDFSERSLAAAQYAGGLACRVRSGIILLHIVPTDPLVSFYVPMDFERSWDACVAEARKRLDLFMAEEFRNMPVTRRTLEGDPAHQIVEAARREHADLIVMPTHGY